MSEVRQSRMNTWTTGEDLAPNAGFSGASRAKVGDEKLFDQMNYQTLARFSGVISQNRTWGQSCCLVFVRALLPARAALSEW